MRAAARPPVAARARLVFVSLLGLASVHAVRGDVLGRGFEPLASVAARHGLVVDAEATHTLLEQRKGRAPQSLVFRASEPENLGDIWITEAVIGLDGRVAAVSDVYNVTRTSSADEGTPVFVGHFAMVARKIDGEYAGLELFDLAAEPPPERGGLAKLQRGVTNLQQTGRFRGVGKRTYTLKTKARTLQLSREGNRFVVSVDGARAVIEPSVERPVEGDGMFEVRTRPTTVSALVPWLVDTARGVSFIGPERIAWLENKVFALRDSAMQVYHSVNSVDQDQEAAEELGLAAKAPRAAEEKVERLAVPNPDSGWPPPAIAPVITPEMAGEGKWRAIVGDPDARELPGGRPVFYQTFLRADPERTWARVYLTIWDPRLVQLHVVAGTQEPVSATGETGRGTIPRTKETLTRLVGAFNGGFQAVHGEFGMMAEGRVYLPPKPWAATVAIFDDGRVGMGSWPGPRDRKSGYDEARAVAEIPAGMVSYRQNLTSLVEDGQFNPWSRWWWGAAPQQQSEQTLTQRSALCTTREGFLVYAWGDSASPEALGAALVASRCLRAMHLDMNAGHSGFEFYNILAPDEPRAPSLDEAPGKRPPFRFQGEIAALPGYTVRARKGVTSMGMALPRYIYPDARDYFYLTLKPGIETSPLPANMPEMSSADLPHAGWPPPFARHSEPGGRVLRIDPHRATPQVDGATGGKLVLAELRGAEAAALDDLALFREKALYGMRYVIGVAPADAEGLLHGPPLENEPHAQSALGVDANGLLLYAESDSKEKGQVARLLREAGAVTAIALRGSTRLGLRFREGLVALDGASRVRESDVLLTFVAQTAPAAEVLFPDTKPMPYARWAQLQDQRVRYFRTSDPSSKAPPGAL